MLITAVDGINSVSLLNANFVLEGGAALHGWLHKPPPSALAKAPKRLLTASDTTFTLFSCQPCLVAVDVGAYNSKDGSVLRREDRGMRNAATHPFPSSCFWKPTETQTQKTAKN